MDLSMQNAIESKDGQHRWEDCKIFTVLEEYYIKLPHTGENKETDNWIHNKVSGLSD